MNAPAQVTERFDLDAYLARIEYTGGRRPSQESLAALHLAHATHIPFENLDVLLGRGIRLDLDSLQAKLVRGGRGGYCFEQNLLFAAALGALGYDVLMLAARVRYRAERLLPRTHMLLIVHVDGADWLADVGFGVAGLLLPIPFVVGQAVQHFAWSYRLVEEGASWVLQSHVNAAWTDLYAFTLEPQQLVDYEVANYYVSTHADSRFTHTLTAQRTAPEGKYLLRNRDFVIDRGTEVESRQLADDEELLAVLGRTFGLDFPAGTRFPYDEPEP